MYSKHRRLLKNSYLSTVVPSWLTHLHVLLLYVLSPRLYNRSLLQDKRMSWRRGKRASTRAYFNLVECRSNSPGEHLPKIRNSEWVASRAFVISPERTQLKKTLSLNELLGVVCSKPAWKKKCTRTRPKILPWYFKMFCKILTESHFLANKKIKTRSDQRSAEHTDFSPYILILCHYRVYVSH